MKNADHPIYIEYLIKIVDYCEKYEAFSIPTTKFAPESQSIVLQDVYTSLKIESKSEYQELNRLNNFISKVPKVNADKIHDLNSDSYIDGLIANIDKKIYDITLEEYQENGVEFKESRFLINVKSKRDAARNEIPIDLEDKFKYFEFLIKNENGIISGLKYMFVICDSTFNDDFDLDSWKWVRGVYVNKNGFKFFHMEPGYIKDEYDLSLTNDFDENSIFEEGYNKYVKSNVEKLSNEKKRIPGSIFLSAPGGGKTTLLKMYAFAYASKILIKENYIIQSDTVDSISKILEIDDELFPIFIKVRDIDDRLFSEYLNFENIIDDAIGKIIGKSDKETEFSSLVSINEIVLIIDGIEEINDERKRKLFIKKMIEFYESHKKCIKKIFISSRYKEYEYSETIHDFEPYYIDEFIIRELSYNTKLIEDFSKNWYKALNKVNQNKMFDIVSDFLVPLKNNNNILRLITNPLELTSLLMISTYDSLLPSDIGEIYGKSIELWLRWNNNSRFHLKDIMSQLAQLSYRMAISENYKIRIKKEDLVSLIKEVRLDLRRYLEHHHETDSVSIENFISYLVRCHIIVNEQDYYEFVHRQYQAYLVAYCITNNLFSKDTRKNDKMLYLKDYIENKDDFWEQIILVCAMQDYILRDEIINALFINSRQNLEDNYYLGNLIELMASQSFHFELDEIREIFEMLFASKNRWRLFWSKRSELRTILYNNPVANNDTFIEIGIKKFKELLDAQDKLADAFFDDAAETLFYTLWCCKSSTVMIRKLCECVFPNNITNSIIREIKRAFDNETIREETVLAIKEVADKSRVHDEKFQSFMLYAAIRAYEKDHSPYGVAISFFEENNLESELLAVNILIIAMWTIQIKEDVKLGFVLQEQEEMKLKKILKKNISHAFLQSDNSDLKSEYASLLIQLRLSGFYTYEDDLWCDEALFNSIVEGIKDKGIFFENSGDFTRIMEIIALYPLFINNQVFEMKNIEVLDQKNIDAILDIFKSDNNLLKAINAYKLLVLFGYWQRDDIANQFDLFKRRVFSILMDSDLRIYWKEIEREIALIQI